VVRDIVIFGPTNNFRELGASADGMQASRQELSLTLFQRTLEAQSGRESTHLYKQG